MNKLQWTLSVLLFLAMFLVTLQTSELNSERSKCIELEAQLENLAYQLEDNVIGFLITKMPDSVGVNIYGITLTYSLEGDSEIREVTIMDTIQQEHKGE